MFGVYSVSIIVYYDYKPADTRQSQQTITAEGVDWPSRPSAISGYGLLRSLSLSRSLHANKRSTPYLRSILLNSVYRRPTQGKQSRLGYLGSSYLLKFEITVVGWASDVGGLVAPLVQNPRLRVAVLSQNAITPIPTATTPQCPTYPR